MSRLVPSEYRKSVSLAQVPAPMLLALLREIEFEYRAESSTRAILDVSVSGVPAGPIGVSSTWWRMLVDAQEGAQT